MATRSAHQEQAPVAMRVPFAASSVAVARSKLKAWMRAEGFPVEVIDDGRIVISELVGNSVRHAKPLPDGTIQITWDREPRGVRISVTDGGSTSKPRRVEASTSAVSGRGMAIVEALAEEWWSEVTRTRCTIHTLLAH